MEVMKKIEKIINKIIEEVIIHGEYDKEAKYGEVDEAPN